MGICTRRFAIRKRRDSSLMKHKFGGPWFTQWEDSWNCTGSRSCTETWSRPTYFWTRRARPNWETSTCLKLPNKDSCIPKRAPLTMRVQKSGTKSHMTPNLIFGRWELSSMKWPHLRYLFKHKIWRDSLILLLKASSTPFLSSILRICGKSLSLCWNSTPPKDQAPKNFASPHFSRKNVRKSDLISSLTPKSTKCSTQSEYHASYKTCQTGYPTQTMNVENWAVQHRTSGTECMIG